MTNISELQKEYRDLDAQIESYERAILRHVDEVVPVETLLLAYRAIAEEYAELRCKMRDSDKK